MIRPKQTHSNNARVSPRSCRVSTDRHLRRPLVHQLQCLLLVLGVLDHEHFPRRVAARAPDHLLVLARRDVRAAALERVQNHHVHGEVHAHRQRGGGDGHADHTGADGGLENLPLVEARDRRDDSTRRGPRPSRALRCTWEGPRASTPHALIVRPRVPLGDSSLVLLPTHLARRTCR